MLIKLYTSTIANLRDDAVPLQLHSANLRLRRSIITVLVSLEGNCSTIWQTDDFPIQCYQSDIETVLVSIISIQCLCIFDTYLPITGFLPRHSTTTDRVGLRNPIEPIDILKSQLTPSYPHFRPQFRPIPLTGPPFEVSRLLATFALHT